MLQAKQENIHKASDCGDYQTNEGVFPKTMELVKQLEQCKLIAYPDPKWANWKGAKPKNYGEPWTIGYGSTKYHDGRLVKQGDTITQEYADALFTDYLKREVEPYLKKIPWELDNQQREALIALIYNVGGPSFIKSKCYKAICEKDWPTVFKEWDWGIHQMKGLINRRAQELAYFFHE